MVQGQLGPRDPGLDDEPVGSGDPVVQVESFRAFGGVTSPDGFETGLVKLYHGLGDQVAYSVGART
jgi:hypothetical protein